MKSVLITSLLVVSSLSAFAQVEVNRQIQMTGATPDNRRITNVSNAADVTPVGTDAVNINTVQRNYVNYSVGTFAGGDYALTLTPAPTAYWAGMRVTFRASAANTGATNLNVNGLGNRALVKPNGGALTAGEISAGQIVEAVFDGANNRFQLVSPQSANAWTTLGNAGTTVGTNFLGTTDNQSLAFRTNNVERFRINTNEEVIAGNTTSPYIGSLLVGYGTVTSPFGVNGYTANNGSGTWGEVLTGSSTNFSGVQGVYGGSGAGSGVLGNYNGTNTNTVRSGVYGVCSNNATGGVGVYGFHNASFGNQHIGVLGAYNGSAFGIGVHGIGFGGGIIAGNNDMAVVGWRANNQNYSGYFNGNHVITNGTKTASVGTSKGNQLLYVTELPEVWFEDVGTAQLINGYCEVKLDPLFLETVFIDETHPMHVFLQEQGECNGLYVTPGKDGFVVKEKNNGTSNIKFSYRIMAKRLHFQDHRFGNDPIWGAGDTRKYNQYATPPPIDYYENVKFQEESKKKWKPTPMPEGFIDYYQIQREAQQKPLTREAKK